MFCGALGTCAEAGMEKPSALLISGKVTDALFSPVTLQWSKKSSLYSFPLWHHCEAKARFTQSVLNLEDKMTDLVHHPTAMSPW